MKYVKRTFTEYTGGGFYVDFVELSDGRCIGISEECIVLYPSFEHFMEQDCYDMPVISLNPFLPALNKKIINNDIFPDFDDVITIPEGYRNTSWHNNACPSIARDIGNNLFITIWIDYKNPNLREGTGKRFSISLSNDECTIVGEFDSLDDAVLHVDTLIKFIKG